MLRPFFIISLVVLAKLHFGDGVDPYDGYGSPSVRPPKLSSFDRTKSTNGRPYDTGRSFTPKRSRRSTRAVAKLLPRVSSYETDHIQKQDLGDKTPKFVQSKNIHHFEDRQNMAPFGDDGSGYVNSIHKIIVRFQDGREMEIPADLVEPGERITEEEIKKRLKKREEENDPLTYQINRDGEVIDKQLPNGGQIVVKISGSNINQRKMNKLRELMTNSIKFVFEHTEFKSSLISRII